MHERIVGSSNLNVELMVALLSFWYRRSLGPFLSASVFYGIWFQVKVRKVLITLPLLLWNHHLQYTMSVLSWALVNQWYDCPLTLCMHMYGDNFICPFSPRIGLVAHACWSEAAMVSEFSTLKHSARMWLLWLIILLLQEHSQLLPLLDLDDEII